MKPIFAGIFLLLYSVALLRPVMPLLDYAVDVQAYQVLCKNQSRPELNCNGKCILAEKLAAMDASVPQPESPIPPVLEAEEWVNAFFQSPFTPFMVEQMQAHPIAAPMVAWKVDPADLPTPPPRQLT